MYTGFKWLLFSFNLDFKLLLLPLSELLKIGGNDHKLLVCQALGTMLCLHLTGEADRMPQVFR